MKNRKILATVMLILFVGCSSEDNLKDVGWISPKDTSQMDFGHKDARKDLPDKDFDTQSNFDMGLIVCQNENDLYNEDNLGEAKGCERSLSSIFFVDYREISVKGLDSLREMGPRANLLFHRTANLEDIDTFANLEVVERALEIRSAPKLVDLTGFKGLKKVTGDFSLSYVPLKNFIGLQNLEYVGLLYVEIEDLESFEGLENLTTIGGNLSVSAPKITENQFREFLEGKSIDGEIRFQGEPFVR